MGLSRSNTSLRRFPGATFPLIIITGACLAGFDLGILADGLLSSQRDGIKEVRMPDCGFCHEQ